MQDKLFIYLHANDLANPSWATGFYAHRGETESLAQAAIDREVVVIVPAEDVVLMNIKLPKMSRSRMLQALPFALEEQLVADVEDLHFAAGEYQGDGSVPVAIVAHEKMQQWLALLKSWHINPDVMVPLTLMLPYDATIWHVLIQDMVAVRTGLFQGFACDRNNFVDFMQIAFASADLNVPSLIYLHNYTNHAYAKVLNVSAEIKEEFLNPDQLLCDLNMTTTFNLLQSTYAVKRAKFSKLKLGWRVAAYLAAAWIFLLFFYPTISYFILKHRINTLDEQMAVIYKRHFPQASSMVAPKLRLQEKLQDLSAQIGENKSLLLMGYIGKGMLETSSIKIKRIDFQNGQLTLELTVPTSEDFSAFTDYLTAQGLSVKQQNANLTSGRISATLQIE